MNDPVDFTIQTEYFYYPDKIGYGIVLPISPDIGVFWRILYGSSYLLVCNELCCLFHTHWWCVKCWLSVTSDLSHFKTWYCIQYYTELWFEDHTHLRTYIINELGKWICVNVSIDTAVEPSGLCGLVVRTFVARYGTRLLGLWGSQVRILSEANFSHIFRNRVC